MGTRKHTSLPPSGRRSSAVSPGLSPVVELRGNTEDFNAPCPLAACVVEFCTTKVVGPPLPGASSALVALSITTICDTLELPAGG
ncbi:hypothetical protein GALL_547500 [mine drainage metagenome]|uniref:Uncharacterized protein n=1 Tax=mine drainage metagenome TaxID=410659 RepID=A0A1J5PJJ7_9ZZZZ